MMARAQIKAKGFVGRRQYICWLNFDLYRSQEQSTLFPHRNCVTHDYYAGMPASRTKPLLLTHSG